MTTRRQGGLFWRDRTQGKKLKALQTAEQINHIAYGFIASKALFSAIDLGVFDTLKNGPMNSEQVAKDVGIAARSMETLLTALVGAGLLEKRDEGFANSPATQTFLVKEGRHYFGDYLSRQIDRQMYPAMGNLDSALAGHYDKTRHENYEQWMSDPKEAELYSRSQHNGSLGPAALLAKRVDLSGAGSLLDVGGGTGAFSITLCQRFADMRSTIIEFSNVASLGAEYVAEAGLAGRIDYLAGNALDVEWPDGKDAVLMSYISSSVSEQGVEALYTKAEKSLVPGGTAIIHDFIINDARDGPALAAYWALQHLTFTPGAVSLTPEILRGKLSAAGFTDIQGQPHVPGITQLVTARKPK